MTRPNDLPLQNGEILIRCPQCLNIGWTVDDDTQPMPFCPLCEVTAEKWREGMEGEPMVILIDGAPDDPAHHLKNGSSL